MMLWNYCGLYAIIRVIGLASERYITALISSGIKLKRLNRLSYTESSFIISKRQLKKAEAIAKEYRIKLEVKSYNRHFSFRPSFITGLAIFIFILIYSSGYCLSYTVTGLKSISEFELSEYIENNGIKYARKSDIDLKKLEADLIKNFDSALYASAYFAGTELRLNIVEAEKPDAYISRKHSDSPLIAKKNGIITEIQVDSGMAAVKCGDFVNQGDILINNDYTLSDGTEVHTDAEGKVIAQLIYRADEIDGNIKEPERTGNSYQRTVFKLGKYSLSLKADEYELSETEDEYSYVINPNGFSIEVIKQTVYELKEKKTEKSKLISELMAKEKAFLRAVSMLSEESEVLSCRLFTYKKGKDSFATAIITAKENIGTYAEINTKVKFPYSDTEEIIGKQRR